MPRPSSIRFPWTAGNILLQTRVVTRNDIDVVESRYRGKTRGRCPSALPVLRLTRCLDRLRLPLMLHGMRHFSFSIIDQISFKNFCSALPALRFGTVTSQQTSVETPERSRIDHLHFCFSQQPIFSAKYSVFTLYAPVASSTWVIMLH